MTLAGECVNDDVTVCMSCQSDLAIGVYQSAAGFYIGFFCNECGPYSRESGYYPTREKAQEALDTGNYWRL